MGKRTSSEEPIIEHRQSYTSIPADNTVASRPSPPSPTLSDMEHDFEIEIELGNQSDPRKSPPIMPSPGEGGPMIPGPPIVNPPARETGAEAHKQAALAPVLSELRRRNVGRIYAGAEDIPGRGIPLYPPGYKKADDAFDGEQGSMGWSKKTDYERTMRAMTNERVKRTLIQAHDKHQALVHHFARLSVSPSKPKAKLATKATNTPKSASSPTKKQAKRAVQDKGPITRFLPPNKEEAFIAFMPDSAEATIELAKRECPSLSSVPSSDLSLALHFDGSPSWVEGTLFRVTPDTWPAAVTGQLPLIHIVRTPSLPKPTSAIQMAAAAPAKVSDDDLMGAFDIQEPNNTAWKSEDFKNLGPTPAPAAGEALRKEAELVPRTWEQLVHEGALLGIHNCGC